MKLNVVEENKVLMHFPDIAVSKKIYSKEDFETYSSLKSVLKPRLINLIKQDRYHEPEPNMESGQANQHINTLSEPQWSDSDSVYSHVRQNYLETNESLAIEMRLEKDNYHMKDDSIDMSLPTHTRRSMQTVVRETFNLRAASEENNELGKNDTTSAIKTGLNSFKFQIPGFANL